jgi:hypothetical protein
MSQFSGLVFAVSICTACFIQYWRFNDQLYHVEVQDMETVQGLFYFTAGGQLSLHVEYFNRPESRLLLDRLLEVLDSNGRALFRNQKLGGNTLGGVPLPDEGVSGFSPRGLRLADGTHVLAISHLHTLQKTHYSCVWLTARNRSNRWRTSPRTSRRAASMNASPSRIH